MIADTLLSQLDRVRKTGVGRWIARCPAHEDRGPSLSIRELADQRVLIHCFAGCGAGDVLGAVGLDFNALYPEKTLGDHTRRGQRSFSTADALRCVAFEALLAATAAATLARGDSLDERERARLWKAAERINTAMEESTWA
jgi:hypothetical protein